jgi:hypothetical protein
MPTFLATPGCKPVAAVLQAGAVTLMTTGCSRPRQALHELISHSHKRDVGRLCNGDRFLRHAEFAGARVHGKYSFRIRTKVCYQHPVSAWIERKCPRSLAPGCDALHFTQHAGLLVQG